MSKRRAADIDSSSPVRRGPPQSRSVVSNNPPSSEDDDDGSDNEPERPIPPAMSLPAASTYTRLRIPGQTVPPPGEVPRLRRAPARRLETVQRRQQRFDTDADDDVIGTSADDPGIRSGIKPQYRGDRPSELDDEFLESYASVMLDIMHEREYDSRIGGNCSCGDVAAVFRCVDCFQPHLLCRSCIVTRHVHQPFHRITEWKPPGYFGHSNLTELGYVLRLGHGGEPCSYYSSQPRADIHRVTVLHINGIHEMDIQYCRCGPEWEFLNAGPNSPYQSLWRAGLFPASYCSPASAATSSVLEAFRLLSVEAKVNSSAYFTFLRRLTAVVFEEESRERSREFLRMFHRWYYLYTCKMRNTRTRHPGESHSAGDLAIFCPACPQPHLNNMAPNWKTRDAAFNYVDARFSTRDGNFKLGQKNKRMDFLSVPLTMNGMYFVDYLKYNKAIATAQTDLVATSCSTFQAMVYHRIKSGVISHICRHNMIEPGGTADLQKGERFISVDMAFVNSHWHYMGLHGLKLFYAFYDIACQWSKNLPARIHDNKPVYSEMYGDVEAMMPPLRFAIGAFHVSNHNELCRMLNDIRTLLGSGRSYGDNAEGVWGVQGRIGPSICEMGTGTREDFINMHFDDFNHQKVVGIVDALTDRAKIARLHRNETDVALRQLENSMSASDMSRRELERWQNEEFEWVHYVAAHHKLPEHLQCPYFARQEGAPTPKEMEAVMKKAGEGSRDDVVVGSGRSVRKMLRVGIEIEGEQCDLKSLLEADPPIDPARVTAATATLKRKIESFQSWRQAVYATAFQVELDAADEVEEADVHEINLQLPSTTNDPTLLQTQCAATLRRFKKVEFSLRHEVVEPTVRKLRDFIAARAVHEAQDQASDTTNTSTRAKAALQEAQRRVLVSMLRFNINLAALQRLDTPENPMAEGISLLTASDIVSPTWSGPVAGHSSNKVSWIWGGNLSDPNTARVDAVQFWVHEGQRVERNLASARAARWAEEVNILDEEMKRVTRFFSHQVTHWMKLGSASSNASPGRAAHRYRQGEFYRALLPRAETQFASWLPDWSLSSEAQVDDEMALGVE